MDKKTSLKNYYKSSHWRKFRDKLLNDIDVECEICHRKKWAIYKRATKKHKKGDKRRLIVLTVHHKTYKNLGHETREDVLVLCRNCHEIGHSLERSQHHSPEPFKKMYEYYKKLTKWDYEKRT